MGVAKSQTRLERITTFFHLLYNASGYHQSSYPFFLPSFKLRYNLHTIEFIFFFFASPCSMRDLISPIRDRTCATCIGNMEP